MIEKLKHDSSEKSIEIDELNADKEMRINLYADIFYENQDLKEKLKEKELELDKEKKEHETTKWSLKNANELPSQAMRDYDTLNKLIANSMVNIDMLKNKLSKKRY